MPYVKIGEATVASNANTLTVSGIPSTYKSYEIWFCGNTTGAATQLNFYVNNSRTQVYRMIRQFFTGSGGYTITGSINSPQTEIQLMKLDGGVNSIARITVERIDGTATSPSFNHYYSEANVGGQAGHGTAMWAGSGAVTSVSVQTSSGTGLINGGKLIVYGLE